MFLPNHKYIAGSYINEAARTANRGGVSNWCAVPRSPGALGA